MIILWITSNIKLMQAAVAQMTKKIIFPTKLTTRVMSKNFRISFLGYIYIYMNTCFIFITKLLFNFI